MAKNKIIKIKRMNKFIYSESYQLREIKKILDRMRKRRFIW